MKLLQLNFCWTENNHDTTKIKLGIRYRLRGGLAHTGEKNQLDQVSDNILHSNQNFIVNAPHRLYNLLKCLRFY